MMSQSFYMGNMSPQVPGFNRGKWKSLEAKVGKFAVELAYMLFTPGPDEAVQPIVTGVAAFILYALSKDPEKLGNNQIIGIALMILIIPLILWTKEKFIDEADERRKKKNTKRINYCFTKPG